MQEHQPPSCLTVWGAAAESPELLQHTSRSMRLNFLVQSRSQLLSRGNKVVTRLEIEPEFGFHSEKTPQTQCGVGRDGTTAVNDFTDPALRHADTFRQTVLSHTHGLEEFLNENFPRVDGFDRILRFFHPVWPNDNQRSRPDGRCHHATQSKSDIAR